MDVETAAVMKRRMREDIAAAEVNVRRAQHALDLLRLVLARFNAQNPDPAVAA